MMGQSSAGPLTLAHAQGMEGGNYWSHEDICGGGPKLNNPHLVDSMVGFIENKARLDTSSFTEHATRHARCRGGVRFAP